MAEAALAPGSGPRIRVTVLVSVGPRMTWEHPVELAEGAMLREALQAAAALHGPGWALPAGATFGVWGAVATDDTALRDGDRVEVYRPLLVDPKTARRQRFARQGARTTGLFARQRPGGKSGY